MEHILNIIENNLRNLNENEREIFRETVLKTFNIIVKKLDYKMKKFEEKVLETIYEKNENINIYSALIPKRDLILYEHMFKPILKYTEYNTIKECYLSDNKIYKEIYIHESLDKVLKINKVPIYGTIFIKGVSFQIEFILEKNDFVYKNAYKELYDIYCLNNIKWRTYLNPYINRMFILKIKYIPEEILLYLDGTEIIEIDYNSYKDSILEDYILTWNISKIKSTDDGIIRPTKNKIHLERNLIFQNNRNIYLCPSLETNIYLVNKIDNNKIQIITDDNKTNTWDLIEVLDIVEEKINKLDYPIFNNKMENFFINSFKEQKDIRIRTESELHRLIASFQFVISYLTLLDISILHKGYDNKEYLYDINDFILDEFRLKEKGYTLLLKFQQKKESIYLYDILNFIVSEIQLYFPEYNCQGELI